MGESVAGRLADLHERIRGAELRLADIQADLAALERQTVDEGELTRALAAFDPVWEQLSTREQARVLQLLIERVEYDGRSGDVAMTFHAAGIRTLNAEVLEEAAA